MFFKNVVSKLKDIWDFWIRPDLGALVMILVISYIGFVAYIQIFSGSAVERRTIEDFSAQRSIGIFSHDLIYQYNGSEPLTEVELACTVRCEKGASPQFERFWANWAPNEKKTINLDASEGEPQSHTFTGKAYTGNERVNIFGSFTKPSQ